MKKFLSVAIRIIIGLLIIIFLLYKLDFIKVYQTILKINLIVILLILLHYTITVLMNTLNLKVLLTSLNLKIKFLDLLKSYLLSYSFGRFSPATLGEFSLIHFLKRRGIEYGKGAVTAVIFKSMVFIILSIIGILGFFLFFPAKQAIKITLFLIILIIIFSFSLISNKIRKLIKKYILRKYSSKFKGFSKNLFYVIKKKKRILLLSSFIYFIRLLLGAFLIYLIFLSFNIKLPIFIIMIINAMGLLVSLIPISISGLGIKESTTVFLYSTLGISAIISGSIYLLLTSFYFIICGIILLTYLKKKRKIESKIQRKEE